MKSVILLGDLPLATKTLRLLVNHPLAEVLGVICKQQSIVFKNDPWLEPCVYDFARELKIPILTINDVVSHFMEKQLDLAFSCRASYILKSDFLRVFSKGVVNMHGGALPEFRGVHICCHSIITGSEKGAGTLHYMDEGIDTGPIIAKKYFLINKKDTAFDVYQKTQYALFSLFEEHLDSILNDQESVTMQEEFIKKGLKPRYFNLKALEKLKRIDFHTMSMDEIDRRVRGCDFPGHEPAYIQYGDNKIYLTTRPYYREEGS